MNLKKEYSFLRILGALFSFGILIFLVYKMWDGAFWLYCVIIGSCLLVYWLYRWIRANREHALLHLIQRITAKELTTHSLENELKEIIRERDNIVKDRFDHIIEKCIVLDLNDQMHVSDFFNLAAQELSPRLSVAPALLSHLLLLREIEGSTMVAPGMAIPHIIVDGQQRFDILLARCKPGIQFHPDLEKAHTVFVLAGSRDERNFHLRALSAIAQILQDRHFLKRWLSAKNVEALRAAVLHGKRIRKREELPS